MKNLKYITFGLLSFLVPMTVLAALSTVPLTRNSSIISEYTQYIGDLFGVGTSTPWAKLSVNPNGVAGPSFVVGSSTATNFTITNGGRVGVNTASPNTTNGQANFTINGGAVIGATNDGSSGLWLQINDNAVRNNGISILNSVGGATAQSSISLTGGAAGNGTSMIGYTAANYTTASGIAKNTLYLMAPSNSTASSSILLQAAHAGGFVAFQTGGTTERMRVDSTGNVGIGTSTPPTLFTVSSQPLGNGTVATTTVDFGDFSTTTSKVCYNTKNTVGTAISFYFVGTTLTVESNRCK